MEVERPSWYPTFNAGAHSTGKDNCWPKNLIHLSISGHDVVIFTL